MPGYPAPDTAWSVVTATDLIPKRRSSGARASVRVAVEQLGLVAMNPFHPRRFFCTAMSSA